jgi:hypothetical protein
LARAASRRNRARRPFRKIKYPVIAITTAQHAASSIA